MCVCVGIALHVYFNASGEKGLVRAGVRTLRPLGAGPALGDLPPPAERASVHVKLCHVKNESQSMH